MKRIIIAKTEVKELIKKIGIMPEDNFILLVFGIKNMPEGCMCSLRITAQDQTSQLEVSFLASIKDFKEDAVPYMKIVTKLKDFKTYCATLLESATEEGIAIEEKNGGFFIASKKAILKLDVLGEDVAVPEPIAVKQSAVYLQMQWVKSEFASLCRAVMMYSSSQMDEQHSGYTNSVMCVESTGKVVCRATDKITIASGERKAYVKTTEKWEERAKMYRDQHKTEGTDCVDVAIPSFFVEPVLKCLAVSSAEKILVAVDPVHMYVMFAQQCIYSFRLGAYMAPLEAVQNQAGKKALSFKAVLDKEDVEAAVKILRTKISLMKITDVGIRFEISGKKKIRLSVGKNSMADVALIDCDGEYEGSFYADPERFMKILSSLANGNMVLELREEGMLIIGNGSMDKMTPSNIYYMALLNAEKQKEANENFDHAGTGQPKQKKEKGS